MTYSSALRPGRIGLSAAGQPWGLFDAFRVGLFRGTLVACQETNLPAYLGSVLRGGFGSALRRVCCPLGAGHCTQCPHPPVCPYAYIFETAPVHGPEVLRDLQDVPRPFVLEVAPLGSEPVHLVPGDRVEFGFVLIGRAVEYLPHCVAALRDMAVTGVGRNRRRLELERVLQVDPSAFLAGSTDGHTIYCSGAPVNNKAVAERCVRSSHILQLAERYDGFGVKLVFETMTRLKHGDRLVGTPEMHVMVRALMRRVSALAYFHHGIRLDLDFRAIIDWSKRVKLVQDRTSWTEWVRYSNKQNSAMKMGGIIGEAAYEGSVEPLLPLLIGGSLVHVGKNVTFGHGKYTVERV